MNRKQYEPGPARPVEVRKDGEKWTLILTRELRHAPEKVWLALTDPAQLREWAPYDADGSLAKAGIVKLTWVGTQNVVETKVTQADAPRVLVCGDMRWELEPAGDGTRLTLWHSINRRYVTWGAAGWHISLDLLERLLGGAPIGRSRGGEWMRSAAWQRLTAEYSRQFGIETPK